MPEQNARITVWACILEEVTGVVITLHLTEFDALQACVRGLDARDPQDPLSVEYALTMVSSVEEIRKAIEHSCADGWYVQEVTLP